MQALVIASPPLKPAVPPLLSRCFARCYSAVLPLFSDPSRAQKMQTNEEVIDVSSQPVFAAEQQTPAEPAQMVEPPRPRGRPWVKGQSSNPHGRPSRAYQAAYVAESLIGRKTVPLTNKLIELALLGDRAALRACLDRILRRDASRRSISICRWSTAALICVRR
jgi:hypothetical protein